MVTHRIDHRHATMPPGTQHTPASRRREGHRRRSLLPSIALLLAAASGLTACGGSGPNADSDAGTLTIAVPAGPVSLDPAKDSFTWGAIRPLTNEFLTHEAADGSIKPALATSWRYLDKTHQNFELTLRRDAKFSDGTPVTAAAVKTWLEYFAAGSSVFIPTMGKIESVETAGKWIVRLRLKEPNPILPFLLSENGNWGAVSSPASVKQPSALSTRTEGAGAYVLDASKAVTDQEYTLVPNKYYYDRSAIRFDKIVVKVITDANSRLQAVRTGQIDAAAGDLTTVSTARSAKLNVAGAPARTYGVILANRVRGPLADVRVRQALNYAIDRTTITRGLVGEAGTASSQMLSRDGYDPAFQNYYRYDPGEAKKLLTAAGYADGFTLEVLEYGAAGKMGTPLAQAIASYWDKIGVKANIATAVSSSEYVEKRRAKKQSVEFYAVLNLPMSGSYRLALGPASSLNSFGADDPGMDALFDKAVHAADPSRYWKQMSQRSVTQAYFVPVFNAPDYWYYADHITGIKFTQARPGNSWATEWSPR